MVGASGNNCDHKQPLAKGTAKQNDVTLSDKSGTADSTDNKGSDGSETDETT